MIFQNLLSLRLALVVFPLQAQVAHFPDRSDAEQFLADWAGSP